MGSTSRISGQAALLDALVARQVSEHLTLRARQPEVSRILLEALAHEPGHVVQQKGEHCARAVP